MGNKLKQGGSGSVGAEPSKAMQATNRLGNDRKKRGHAKPLPVPHELGDLKRLRVGHLMSLLSISHATLYARLLTGTIPKPDGKDGKRPYWKTSTVRALLDG
jgi:hypothetical protein